MRSLKELLETSCACLGARWIFREDPPRLGARPIMQRLSYTWDVYIVAWTLTPTQTRVLRMEQSGYQLEQEANYQGATYGWQKFIGGRERVVSNI